MPWKQRRGYATRALAEILLDAKNMGLGYVELTTPPDNIASRKVIEANGGICLEEFITAESLGAKPELRFRIDL